MVKTNQLIALKIPRYLVLSKPKVLDVFDFGLFFYFITLHADQLSLTFGGFSFRLNNFLVLFLAPLLFIRMRHGFSIDKKLLASLLFIGFSLSISCVFSPFPKRCLFFLGWYCFTVMGYVLFPYFLIKKLDAEKIFRFYLASFIVVGIYAFMQLFLSLFDIVDPFVGQFSSEKSARPNAFAYEPSFYALYMTPFIMMVNFHFLSKKGEPFFIFAKINLKKLLLINFLFLLSTSTSTFFAYFFFLVIVCGYAICAKKRDLLRRTFQFMLFCIGCVGAACCCVPFLMKHFFLKFFYFGFMTHHSFYERWRGICNGWEIFKEHYLLGVGLGAIPAYLYEAWVNGNSSFRFLSLDFYLMDLANPLKFFEPTCVLLETMGSLGIFGTTAFFYFFFVIFRRLQKSVNPHRVNFAISILLMLIILQFNQGLFRTYIWVHLALLFAYAEKSSAETT